ncbi:PRD domain-containing protein [Enterococcus sp. LJL120]
MSVIKKVLNSSVVLVEKNGQEMIALGKGIGFGKKAGEEISDEQVDKIFLEADEQKPSQLAELVGEIPFEFFELTRDIIQDAQEKLAKELNSNLYLTLTDHLHFAVERGQENLPITNRLHWEIKSYYPKEFAVALTALEKLNQTYQIDLPEEEASNIAFHLINAQVSQTDAADGFRYAKMTGEIVNLVRYSIQRELDTNSLHYTRFITHVRFFVERFFSESLLHEGETALHDQMWNLFPEAAEIAIKVRDFLEKTYKKTIPNEETFYLAVHINRLLKHMG